MRRSFPLIMAARPPLRPRSLFKRLNLLVKPFSYNVKDVRIARTATVIVRNALARWGPYNPHHMPWRNLKARNGDWEKS